jgi:hypothetical protein
MALTAQQILDIRGDLGIGASGASDQIFSDTELNALFDRAAEDYNLAVYFGWRQTLASSAKWIDYQVAQTKVSRSQAFDHIKAMVAFWGDESRTTANQVKIVGIRDVPTRHKPIPGDEYTLPSNKGNRSHTDWRNW